MNEMEDWRPVVGYEGLYSVSNLGRVRSEDRIVTAGVGRVRHQSERILKPGSDRGGYLIVTLCNWEP